MNDSDPQDLDSTSLSSVTISEDAEKVVNDTDSHDPTSTSPPLVINNKTSSARDWTRTITVRVGPEDSDTKRTRDFIVHEHILRAHSAFFEAALSHDWKESHQRIVKLPEGSPHTFDIYVHWIYSHKLEFTVKNLVTGIQDLIDAYILGDVLLDGDFRDRVIDDIVKPGAEKTVLLRKLIGKIYENTKEKDRLRTLAIDSVVYGMSNIWIIAGQQKKDVPEEALWDIVAAMHKASGFMERADAPFRHDTCHYHVHESGIKFWTKRRRMLAASLTNFTSKLGDNYLNRPFCEPSKRCATQPPQLLELYLKTANGIREGSDAIGPCVLPTQQSVQLIFNPTQQDSQ
ncbi:hypothetical protein E6O75_ATG06466 [Venturia nashicola]|uniref:BTB domain-containing protein n=1 Tax=Venturia nashicola TaxID=86259 RepID=A0A4Z1P2Q1_9PEZI|nr:hypothetical protein E6O75_ATG06466 [Venturia nashicola]